MRNLLPNSMPWMTVSDRSHYLLTEIHDPNPGVWNIQVLASTEPGADFLQSGFITVMANSPDKLLHVALSETAVTDPMAGLTAFIMPRWKRASLLGASVTANLVAPDGSVQPLIVRGGQEAGGDDLDRGRRHSRRTHPGSTWCPARRQSVTRSMAVATSTACR